jgi:hypothetical protein
MNLEEIFSEAVKINSATDRNAFLDKACAGDSPLAHALTHYLRPTTTPHHFLRQRLKE